MREAPVGYADSYRGGNRTQGGMGASRTDGVETKNDKVDKRLANTVKHVRSKHRLVGDWGLLKTA